jgi:hypothetical protein
VQNVDIGITKPAYADFDHNFCGGCDGSGRE